MSTKQSTPETTLGLDLGDRKFALCRLNREGEVVDRRLLPTPPDMLERYFSAVSPARVVLEAGTHSPWISRLLARLGRGACAPNLKHEKIPAPRRL